MQNWLLKDDRFKLIRQSNSGQAAARFNGLKRAKGDYITFADSDDFVSPNWLLKLVQGINTGADISVIGYDNYNEKNDRFFLNDHSVYSHVSFQPNITLDWLLSEQMEGFLWNKLFRRELFSNVNLNPPFNFMEDVYIIGQMVPRLKKVSFIGSSEYHYRVNSNSTLHKKFNMSDINAYSILINQLENIEKNFLKDSLIVRNAQIRHIKIAINLFQRVSFYDRFKCRSISKKFIVFLRDKASPEAINFFSLYTRIILKLIVIFKNPILFFHFRKILVWIKMKITHKDII